MSKIKKLFYSTIASSIVMASIQTIPASATNSPCAYTKLGYVDGNMVRVDVYFENMDIEGVSKKEGANIQLWSHSTTISRYKWTINLFPEE